MKKFLFIFASISYFSVASATFNVDFFPCEVKSKDIKQAEKEMKSISKKIQKELDSKMPENSNLTTIQKMDLVIELAKKYNCQVSEVQISSKKD